MSDGGGNRPLKEITIYTDGACLGNPGPGGYAAILDYRGVRREIGGGWANTTNNRMEMMAAIAGLEALKEPCRVRIVSDSQYLVKAINDGWLEGWKKRNWRTKGKSPVKNIDLWTRLDVQLLRHKVSFEWIRGHAGHPENERCDELSVEIANRRGLPPDPARV